MNARYSFPAGGAISIFLATYLGVPVSTTHVITRRRYHSSFHLLHHQPIPV